MADNENQGALIANHSHYDANSNGISAGAGVGNTGKAIGPGSVSGSGGVVPMMSQNENGDSSATTRSAVSAGTITVADGAHQTQDVAGLSRDTTSTNGTVANTPDVNAILNQQADTMQAAQAAGQVVAQGIGVYADNKRDDAVAAAKAAAQSGDVAAGDAALADYDNWKEGGNDRAILQVAGGALIAGLGGGAFGAIGGAAGAGVSSKLAPQTKAFADSVTDGTGSSLAGNIAGNVLSGLAGAAVGGTAGAAAGSNVNLYNQQNDKNETEAQKEANVLRKQFDQEKVMLGQAGAKAPQDAEGATLPGTALAAAAGGKSMAVTSNGTANSATVQGLKGQLVNENLANIAAADPRLATAVSGSGASSPNFSIGTGTSTEANTLGKLWVGDGATLVSNQTACPGCLVSADGTMIYRPPQPKSSQFATTGVQANFVRQTPSGQIISNGHLNVTP